MATATAAPVKVKKTVVARDAIIKVLTTANKPMTIAEIVKGVGTDPAAKKAGIPRGTISAQINFELQEKKPRIVRFERGLYGAKGVKAPAPAKAAAAATGGKATPKAEKPEEAPAAPETDTDAPVDAPVEDEVQVAA